VEVSTADLVRGVEDFLNYFSFAAAILSLERAMRSRADSRGRGWEVVLAREEEYHSHC